jgi:hypothetical protein
LGCPALSEKIFPFSFDPNHFTTPAVSSQTRGVSRSSRTRGGMRWTLIVPLTNGARGGRRSRVVLTPRRWRQVGGGNFADDGGKKARSPGRARRKPLKPLRAGMPGCSGGLVVTTRVLSTFAHEAAGASAPGIPHALYWAKDLCTTRARRAAGMRRCIQPSLRGALATKQSSFLFRGAKAGLLRGACHRARVRATRWLAMTISGRSKIETVQTFRKKERGSNLRWSPSTVRALPGMCPNRSSGRDPLRDPAPGELTYCRRARCAR